MIEAIGPELRQYIVADNDEERPFSRDQRRWIYASSKGVDNYFGFGTDNDLETATNYPIVKHRTFAENASAGHQAGSWLPSAKVIGSFRKRRHAFRPDSVVNVSAMSYGSLSGPAIQALNAGVGKAGALQNTGEGGLSDDHRQGGELIYQIGTAYFGCRDRQGRFDLQKLVDMVASAPVRAIEIKLSQGAKPGLGGLLPAAKVSPEIARIRGIEPHQDCASPSRHTAFSDVDSMLDFVETIADATGLPVGVKSAVGDQQFWVDLAERSAAGDRGVDFITIDGGEGGTGAAPRVFADTVALPFRLGFARVYAEFARAGLTDRISFIGSGRLGLPENAVTAFALGCDMINVAREAMLAIGCIQAQRCHTDHCPTGVATQNKWLTGGLDPTLKSERLAAYLRALRHDLITLTDAIGVVHPSLIGIDDVEMLTEGEVSLTLREIYGYEPGWGQPSTADAAAIKELMATAATTATITH